MSNFPRVEWLDQNKEGDRHFALQPYETISFKGIKRASLELPKILSADPSIGEELPLVPILYGGPLRALKSIVRRRRQAGEGLYPYMIRGGENQKITDPLPFTGVASAINWKDKNELPEVIDRAYPHLELSAWKGHNATASEYGKVFISLLAAVDLRRGLPIAPTDDITKLSEGLQVYSVTVPGHAKEKALDSIGLKFVATEDVHVGATDKDGNPAKSRRNIWAYQGFIPTQIPLL